MKSTVDLFEEALRCKTKKEADAWFLEQVTALAREADVSDKEAATRLQHNLGYFSGYYSIETAQRLFEMFNIRHPYFGTPQERAALSPEEILQMGMTLARIGKARP